MRNTLFAICAALFLSGALCHATVNATPLKTDGPVVVQPRDGNLTANCMAGQTCGEEDHPGQPRLTAGDGNPTPNCIPGHTCGDQDQLRRPRLTAGDGNPTPICIPGHTCGDQDQLRRSVRALATHSRLGSVTCLMNRASMQES